MSRDDARTHLDAAIECINDLDDNTVGVLLNAVAQTLIAIAYVQLEQLELSRRVRTK